MSQGRQNRSLPFIFTCLFRNEKLRDAAYSRQDLRAKIEFLKEKENYHERT